MIKMYCSVVFYWFCVAATSAGPALAGQENLPLLTIAKGEPLPDRNELQTLRLGRVNLLAYDRSSTMLASSSASGVVCLWDISSGRPRRCFTPTAASPMSFTALAFSEDERLAAGRADGGVVLWRADGTQVQSGCQLGPLSEKQTLGRAISSLLFTRDGGLLSVGARNGTIRVCPRALTAPGAPAPDTVMMPIAGPELAGFSGNLFEKTAGEPSGRLLAVATHSGIGVWRISSGEQQWFQPISSLVTALTMSRDGKRLAAGLLNGNIFLWSVETGSKLPLPSNHGGRVEALAFSADGGRLAASFEDRSVSLWDARSRKHLHDFFQSGISTAIAFSPDDDVLAAAAEGSGITLWETATGNVVQTLQGNADWIRSVAFNQAGTRMVTASDDQRVRVWQRKSAVSGGPEWSLLCSTGLLEAGVIHSVALRPNGQQIAVAMDSPNVALVNAETCVREALLKGSTDWVKSVAYNPDGRKLAAAADDGSVSIWDLESEKPPRLLLGHRDAVQSLVFSPRDGSVLATTSLDNTTRLWQSSTGELLHTFHDQASRAGSIDISPDGAIFALALDKGVELWDLNKRSLLGKLEHKQPVTAVRFSPDGMKLATASEDGKVRLWDLPLRQLSYTLAEEGEQGKVLAIAFLPGRAILATATLGRVTLWNLTNQKVYAELRQGGKGWAYLALDAPDGRLFRSDTGGLLWKRAADGSLEALAPPRAQVAPQLDLQIRFQPAARGNAQLGIVTAIVSNSAAGGTAYWLRLQEGERSERTELHEPFSIVTPPVHPELLPGQSVELKVQLIDRHPSFLPPRVVRFYLTVRHAHDGQYSSQYPGLPVVLYLGSWWWRFAPELVSAGFLLAALLGITAMLLQRRRRLCHPVVMQALAGHSVLRKLTLRELPEADQALRRAEKFRKARGVRTRALRLEGISDSSWQRVLAALGSAEDCAGRFVERLAATLANPLVPLYKSADLTAFKVTLPPLSINIPAQVVLVIGTDPAEDAQTVAAHFSAAQLGGPEVVFFVDLTLTPTPSDEAKKVLEATHPGTTFVVIEETVLRRILLAKDALQAQESLLEAIVAQYPLEQIIPYKEGSNELKDEQGCFFFGRLSELELMLGQYRHNFLLVGPRFMGKSSLLNALHRELSRRYPQVKVIKYQLFSDSLIPHFSQDPTFHGDSPEAFYNWVMQRSSEHQLFLLDETDKFIEKENATHFRFCSVMRSLSGQGRASFILAGHQKLHDATRTPDHPLRNFGQMIRLGPLDRSSAEQMILDPMKALGLRFSDRAGVVDWLAEATGCRPHLLSRACLAVVRLRQPFTSTPIGLQDIQRKVLSCGRVRADFESWDNGNVDPLDRALTRTALLLGQPKRAELVKYLRERGLHLSADDLEQSLSRLYGWHYALIEDEQERLYCPVPLFRHWLTETRPEFPRSKSWNSGVERLAEELENDLAELLRDPSKTWRAAG